MIRFFQGLSFVLTIISFVYVIGLSLKRKRLNKRSLYIVLIPLAALSFFLAYGFDWTKNSNNDLYRWLLDVARMSASGFNTEVYYLEDYDLIFKLYLWIFTWIDNWHLVPAIAITVENIIYFYILVNVYDLNELELGDVLISIVAKYAFVPFAMSALGFQGVVATAFFSLGYYHYYSNNRLTIKTIICMVVSILIHASAIVLVIPFIISLLLRKHKVFNYLLILWPLLSGLIGVILGNMNNTYSTYALLRWNLYRSNYNNYDHFKAQALIFPFIFLIILLFYWYLKKSDQLSRNRMAYIITNSSVTVGAYFIVDLLFLRLCYSFGFLFPLIVSEIKERDDTSIRKISIFNSLLTLSIILLFLLTRGDWILQTYDIFWVSQH